MNWLKQNIALLRQRLPVLNIVLAAFAWTANQYLVQGFCQPVAWAGIVLAFSIGAFLAWPWLAKAPLPVRYGALFLQGLAFTVCAYCAWFMSLQAELYSFGLFFFWLLVPALVWVPLFFGGQLLRRVARAGMPGRWPVFLLGLFALAPALWWADQQYQQLEAVLLRLPLQERRSIPVLVRVLPRSYMVERVAGAMFLYHTEPEFFLDGWRPPLHDPLLVICLQLHQGSPLYTERYWFPLVVDGLRAQLYHDLFPDRRTKADCVCSHQPSGESYRRWLPPAGR
jgi:hypothetical protein